MLFHYLFLIGSLGGFFLELFYRKIVFKKWIKPGVFKGFYLPLYGMGLSICYWCYTLEIPLVFKLILVMISLTLIEFICGLIFIKGLKIPLWDYSNNFLNYRGLICMKFSIYWLVLESIFFFIFKYVTIFVTVLMNVIVVAFEFVLVIDVVSFFIHRLTKLKKKNFDLDL